MDEMNSNVNVLLLSVGTRNKIVQYFSRALKGRGKLIATDMNKYAPAIYEADCHYIVPRINHPGYIDIILDICRKEKVNAVLSLIDPELSLLAKNKRLFEEMGVTVIGSSYELCELSLDKMEMEKFCRGAGFKCARSWNDLELFKKSLKRKEVSFPVFVKPQFGSASIAISKAEDIETVEFLFKKNEGLMIQEFLAGQEIGADVYIDMISGEVINIFTKKKILMRAGETDKSVSFKNQRLFDIIKDFVNKAGFRGQIDIDIFEISGDFYISEVNPRFGGGYPHAYEAGCNSIDKIFNNIQGYENTVEIGNYKENLVMMKFNEMMFINA